uniref:Uncharacterized protein n=1 Tax=Nelumbo nucifera TaxID=4432 RepID=A0A822Y097_NELNU|nr:TPA_asm: hypothetical protein HUJ06_026375 [Nelumbo nucifera]
MASKPESVRSPVFLMDKDSSPLQSAMPSNTDSMALQIPWNCPSFSDFRPGHLEFSTSNAGPASMTLRQTSRVSSSSKGRAAKNSSRAVRLMLASSAGNPSSSRSGRALEREDESARWRRVRRGQ